MKIPFLRGRDFDARDGPGSPRAVIVSHSLATRFSADGDMIGKRVNVGSLPEHQNMEVVGIVADANLLDIHHDKPLAIYCSVNHRSGRKLGPSVGETWLAKG